MHSRHRRQVGGAGGRAPGARRSTRRSSPTSATTSTTSSACATSGCRSAWPTPIRPRRSSRASSRGGAAATAPSARSATPSCARVERRHHEAEAQRCRVSRIGRGRRPAEPTRRTARAGNRHAGSPAVDPVGTQRLEPAAEPDSCPRSSTSGVHVVIVSPFASDPVLRRGVRAATAWTSRRFRRGTRPSAERVVDSVLSEAFLRQSGLEAVRLQRDRARLLDPWRGRSHACGDQGRVVTRCRCRGGRWFQRRARLEPRAAHRRAASRGIGRAGRHGVGRLFHGRSAAHLRRASGTACRSSAWISAGTTSSSKYHTILPVDRARRLERGHAPAGRALPRLPASRTCLGGRARRSSTRTSRICSCRRARRFWPLRDVARRPCARHGGDGTAQRLPVHALADRHHRRRDRPRSRSAGPAHLLVRVHPRDDLGALSPVRGTPARDDREADRASRRCAGHTPSSISSRRRGTDRRHLAATLAYSDVLVNFASTTTIEACVFDTPVINVGFDEAGRPARAVVDPAVLPLRALPAGRRDGGGSDRRRALTRSIDALRAYLADRSRDQRREARARRTSLSVSGWGRRSAAVPGRARRARRAARRTRRRLMPNGRGHPSRLSPPLGSRAHARRNWAGCCSCGTTARASVRRSSDRVWAVGQQLLSRTCRWCSSAGQLGLGGDKDPAATRCTRCFGLLIWQMFWDGLFSRAVDRPADARRAGRESRFPLESVLVAGCS